MSLRKARAKQTKQDDTKVPEPATATAGKDVSKRELVRRGEYVQVTLLLPKDNVTKLKHMALDGDKDLSEHTAAAIALYLDSLAKG